MSGVGALPKLLSSARGLSHIGALIVAAEIFRRHSDTNSTSAYAYSEQHGHQQYDVSRRVPVAHCSASSSSLSLVQRDVVTSWMMRLPVAFADAPVKHANAHDAPTAAAVTATPKTRASSATYNANNPSEDRSIAVHEHGWDIAGVFDGHGGWQVAEFAHTSMMRHLGPRLLHQNHHDEKGVTASLTQSFLAIENAYIDAVLPSYKLGFGDVGKVGSCVIVAARKEDALYVANAGDCRAVMGTALEHHKNSASSSSSAHPDGVSFVATRLSRDHNARMPTEALALRENHPNEKDIVICKNAHACYVKGRLQVTRSLGDMYLKSESFNSPLTSHKSSGRHIPSPYTPPYLSAAPEVHRYSVGPNDKFVILASDGLWDFLSDQEAVEVVARVLDLGHSHHDTTTSSTTSLLTLEQRRELAAEALVEATMARAAEVNRTSVAQLKALPAGSERRRKHDDTTVVVMFLD